MFLKTRFSSVSEAGRRMRGTPADVFATVLALATGRAAGIGASAWKCLGSIVALSCVSLIAVRELKIGTATPVFVQVRIGSLCGPACRGYIQARKQRLNPEQGSGQGRSMPSGKKIASGDAEFGRDIPAGVDGHSAARRSKVSEWLQRYQTEGRQGSAARVSVRSAK